LQDTLFLDSGSAAANFQGIALVNPSTNQVTATLRATDAAGSVVATTTVTLAPGQLYSKLLSEYFTASLPRGSVIRITSTEPIIATSITGSLTGETLRSIPALR
jgi:hypothetical protein